MLDTNSMPTGYQGYQDPNLINQTFGYAGGLTKGGLRDEPITSPWQGARMMADALAGGMMRNRAGQIGQGNRNQDASGLMGAVPHLPGQPISQAPFSANPPPSGGLDTPPMAGTPPVPGLAGSVPSGAPGGPPGPPGGLTGGMQLPPLARMGGMGGGQPPDSMMQALMSQPPGMGVG